MCFLTRLRCFLVEISPVSAQLMRLSGGYFRGVGRGLAGSAFRLKSVENGNLNSNDRNIQIGGGGGGGEGPSVGMAGRRPMRHLEICRPIQTFSKRIDFGLTWREGIRLLTGQFFQICTSIARRAVGVGRRGRGRRGETHSWKSSRQSGVPRESLRRRKRGRGK